MKTKVIQRYQLFTESHVKDVFQLLEGASLLQSLRKTAETQDDESKDEELEVDTEGDTGLSQSMGAPEPSLDLEADDTLKSAIASEVGMVCSTCNATFASLQDQRQHFRLDWHRYNVKRKSHLQAPVGEEEFDNLLDGLSSISGSDEEVSATTDRQVSRLLERVRIKDEDESQDSKASELRQRFSLKHHAKIFFQSQQNETFAFYKSILPTKKVADPESQRNALEYVKEIAGRPPTVAVIMISGGHFAAAVFQGMTEIVHKTFHSYTVRAKQGGSQGLRDNKSATSHPKSAGASLRRYNEQAFKQHVQDLLASWKEKLESCQLIFYRAVSFNQNILFAGTSPPLDRTDIRLRTIPFPTKRPTFSEVKRVFANLSAVEVLEVDESQVSLPRVSPQRKKPADSDQRNGSPTKSRSKTVQEEPDKPPPSPEPSDEVTFEIRDSVETVELSEALQEYADSLTPAERKRKPRKKKTEEDQSFLRPAGDIGELLTAIEKSKDDLAKELIQKLRQEHPISDPVWNTEVDANSSTLLHHASRQDLQEVVWLLLECGCNPSSKDKTGKVPYNYCPSKEGRKVFMRFMAEYPDSYDYSRAQIPGPLTKEMEEERAEKQRAINKAKREKEKQKKLAKKEKQAELSEQERFLNLSDREKRALAAEKRILSQAARSGETKPVLVRCFDCASDITGKVPFEYNQNVFCSTKCLAAHRRKFPTPLSV